MIDSLTNIPIGGIGMEQSCPPTHPALIQAKNRLSKIEGQVRGISKMVEENKYCMDILNQISAAKAALNNTALLILQKHLETCVSQAMVHGGQEQDKIIAEIMSLLKKQEL